MQPFLTPLSPSISPFTHPSVSYLQSFFCGRVPTVLLLITLSQPRLQQRLMVFIYTHLKATPVTNESKARSNYVHIWTEYVRSLCVCVCLCVCETDKLESTKTFIKTQNSVHFSDTLLELNVNPPAGGLPVGPHGAYMCVCVCVLCIHVYMSVHERGLCVCLDLYASRGGNSTCVSECINCTEECVTKRVFASLCTCSIKTQTAPS